MAKFFKELGMPEKLRDFGIEENCSASLAELCTFSKTRTVKSYIEMDYDVLKDIFDSCY